MRTPATWDVWVYWECDHLRDVSHVRDLSLSGLFLETHRCRPKGESLRIHFLVAEGQIRLDGIVTRVEPRGGLGLKFQSLTNDDAPRLGALVNRIRTASSTASEPPRLINFVRSPLDSPAHPEGPEADVPAAGEAPPPGRTPIGTLTHAKCSPSA